MTDELYTIRTAGMTVSRSVWNRFKRPMPGLADMIMSRQPELSRSGPFLAVGAVVRMPVEEAKALQQKIETVTLWD